MNKALKNLTKTFLNLKIEKPNEKENNIQENPFDKNDYIIDEKKLSGSHKPISLEQNEKINSQLKNTICNIILKDGERGTGFFTKIKFPDKKNLLQVLLTCNHVIDKSFLSKNDILQIQINNTIQTIDLKDRIIYTNEEKDITIIQIKEKKDNIQNFLELDEENQDIRISGKTVYILQYLDKEGPSVSFGILKDANESVFSHSCNTDSGSSGSPILYLKNNKVIGIHKGSSNINNYNFGRFLNSTINDFIKKINENKITEIVLKSSKKQSIKKVYIEDREINKDNNYDYSEFKNFDISSEKNSNIEEIINEKKIIDECDNNMSYTCNIFKNIKILNLTNNNLSDINILEKMQLENLEKLCLDNNKISDIDILEKVNYKELKELYLNGNNISNIEILEKVNFPNLQTLDLSCNKITNIDVFEKVNFPKLNMLSFHKNNLTKIDKIKLSKLESLNLLALSHNEGIDIDPLKDAKFENLQYLFLADINLKAIDIFSSIAFKHLKLLTFGGNNISNIKALSKVDFKELEDLVLYDNKITDIEVLAEVNFPKLKILNLSSNKITNIEVLKNVNFPELTELDLQQNNIVEINVFKNCKFKKLFKLNIKLNKIDIDKNLDIINELKKKNINLFK